MTVTDEIVVRQTEGAQSVHVLEHVFTERRQVVVVQGPGTWNMCSLRLCNLCLVRFCNVRFGKVRQLLLVKALQLVIGKAQQLVFGMALQRGVW